MHYACIVETLVSISSSLHFCLFLYQVRAHQLVLPPCDVIIRAVANYVRNIEDIANLEAIAQDIFKNSQVTALSFYSLFFFIYFDFKI